MAREKKNSEGRYYFETDIAELNFILLIFTHTYILKSHTAIKKGISASASIANPGDPEGALLESVGSSTGGSGAASGKSRPRKGKAKGKGRKKGSKRLDA